MPNVKDNIKPGATGSYLFINTTIRPNGEKLVSERGGRFRVAEKRSKDFIIETIEDNKRIYCQYPKNAKPWTENIGNTTTTQTETFELSNDLPGYHRFIRSVSSANGETCEFNTAVTIKFHGF